MKNKNLLNQILKFGLIGGIAFVIDYLVLIICKELFNLNLFLSTAIAFTVSVIFNYISSIKWVFDVDKEKNTYQNFTIFIILSIIGLILTEIIMDFGVYDLKFSYLIVKIAATAIVMVFNFITRKIFLEGAYQEHIKKAYYSDTFIVICSIITYLSLCLNGVIKRYDILSLLILFILIIWYKKNFIIPKEYKKAIPLFSLIFSFLLVFGSLCVSNLYSKDINIIKELFSRYSIISLIGNYLLIKVVLNYLFPKLYQIEIIKNNKKKTSSVKVFLLSFVIMLLAWTPYLLTMYPGLISVDSLGELIKASNAQLNYDNHTIAHLLVVRLSYIIGHSITNNMNIVVLVYSLIQMSVMSILFSYLYVFLYNRNVTKKVLTCIILFYALVPIFGYLSIVMWKDIFFGTFCLWLSIVCYKISEEEQLTKKTLIEFIVASLCTLFFRNNAIYMYIILIIFTFIIFYKNWKKFVITFTIIMSIFIIIKYPIFSYFNVEKSGSAEYLAIPMQQIGRMIYKNNNLTKKEVKEINKILNVKTIEKVYNPACADAIKFHEDFNIKNFNKNKFTYLKLWIQLVFKHKTAAIEAYSMSTLGFWYPNIKDRAYEVVSVNNNIGVTTKNITPDFIKKIILKLGDYELPIVCFFWSIGLLIWITWIFMYMTYKKGKLKSIYTFIPVIGVWITLIIATPVYNETRYIFSLFTTIPLFVTVPYLKSKIKGRNIMKQQK